VNVCDAARAASPCDCRQSTPPPSLPDLADKPRPSFACRQSIPRPTSASPSDYPHRHDGRPADKPSLPETAHDLVRLTDPYPTIPGRRLISRHASPLLPRPSDMPRSSRAEAAPPNPVATIPSVPNPAVPTYLAVPQPSKPTAQTQAETCRHANPRHPDPPHASPGPTCHIRRMSAQPDEPSLATWHPDPTCRLAYPGQSPTSPTSRSKPALVDQPSQPRTDHALPTSQPHPDRPRHDYPFPGSSLGPPTPAPDDMPSLPHADRAAPSRA
jgi:hypothetical protein